MFWNQELDSSGIFGWRYSGWWNANTGLVFIRGRYGGYRYREEAFGRSFSLWWEDAEGHSTSGATLFLVNAQFMNRNPLFTAYRDTDELLQLREWFFNQEEVDNRKRAIAKVKSLKTRRHVAHSLDMTSLLTGIILNDESGLVDSDTLTLSYTMAVIKFVNGTLDSLQQASHAIPLHALARELDIPSYFVETRHAGSHEHLPSLQMLRMVGKNVMDWLWNHYWCEIRSVSEQLTLENLEDFRPARDFDYINWVPEDFEEIIRNGLKTFKRIRRIDINKKRADKPDTTEYKKTVSSLINLQTQEPQLFLDVFQDEILSLHKTLTDSMLKGLLLLSKPLIEELGLEFFAVCS